jgi:hypothetical protein
MSENGSPLRPVEIVGFGVDTLVLNIYPTDSSFTLVKRRVSAELQEELTLLKQRAQDEEEDIPSRFVFGGLPLLMRTKGSEGFNWILHNRKLTIAVNRGSKMSLLGQVRFSSEYLWSVRDAWGKQDISKALAEVHVFLTVIFGEYFVLQPSAVDLAVDVVNLHFGTIQQIEDHFITRAQMDDRMPLDADEDGFIDGPDRIKRRWRRLTGLPFGARNAVVSALLYDKTHEIKYKSPEKGWLLDLWREMRHEDGTPIWDGVSPVWRNEMRFKRRALHEMKKGEVFHGIEDAYELESRLADLWAYAVGHVGGGADGLPDGWLRYVVPTEDTNRSRWPVHPAWQVIQSAFTPEPLPESDHEWEEREREELLQEVEAELTARPFVAPSSVKRSLRDTRVSAPSVAAPVDPPPVVSLDLLPIIRKRHYEVNMRRMVAQIAGCTITAEAWRRSVEKTTGEYHDNDISSTFHYLFENVQDYLQEKHRDFKEAVEKKRALYSIDQVEA